jgi:hypothetical protein
MMMTRIFLALAVVNFLLLLSELSFNLIGTVIF